MPPLVLTPGRNIELPQIIGKFEGNVSSETKLRIAAMDYRRHFHTFLENSFNLQYDFHHSSIVREPIRAFHLVFSYNVFDHKRGMNPRELYFQPSNSQ